MGERVTRLGYADPPYIGCAHLYSDQPTYAGEVDHAELINRLESEFDGWVLHAAATPRSMAILAPLVEKTGARWMSWVIPVAAQGDEVREALEPFAIGSAVTRSGLGRTWRA